MKLLNIKLYTHNLEATRLFYVGRLGLPLLSRSAAHLTVVIGWTHLTFRLVGQPVTPYHLAINVPRGSLEVAMYYFDFAYLDTQAPGKTIADFPDWRARSCYFYDNAGNLLEFIARTDLPLDDSNLTINALFQGVSELGLATEDVAHTTALLQRRFGIGQFTRTLPAPDFNALGDDNGLFVLSRVGRKWLFSDTPTGLSYWRVQFSNESAGQLSHERNPNPIVHELYSYEVNRLPIGKDVKLRSAIA